MPYSIQYGLERAVQLSELGHSETSCDASVDTFVSVIECMAGPVVDVGHAMKGRFSYV